MKDAPATSQATELDDHEWAKTEAGFKFVESMVSRADDKRNLMWFGWALREAFVAGAEWQEKRGPRPADMGLETV